MTLAVGDEALEVLRRGVFCSLLAPWRGRPHVTPVVYVLDGGRLWLTTSRRSVKARAWREDDRTAGAVVDGELAVTFRGVARAYDLLDPGSWGASAVRSPWLTRAALRFSRKNARFFAGYARDARRIPLAWTPPARVFVGVELEAAALLDLATGALLESWGEWPGELRGERAYRALRRRQPPEARLPDAVRTAVGEAGDGFVGLLDPVPAVLPATWVSDAAQGAFTAAVARAYLALAGARTRSPMSLAANRNSAWRASAMRGFLAHGEGTLHVPRGRPGAALRHAVRRAGGGEGSALVRIPPERLVWWSGWATGTVR